MQTQSKLTQAIHIPNMWKDFALLDSGEGLKLEQWGKCRLVRPDPQALWAKSNPTLWRNIDATYNRHKNLKDQEGWQTKTKTPNPWNISYRSMTFELKLTSFKHTGLFPEQAVQWDWMFDLVGERAKQKPSQQPSILNLFGYTGAASLACMKAGAKVTHVDASHGTIRWCKRNAELSNLPSKGLRTIVDDVFKFVRREQRRSNHYDGIVMDPPAFGRGTTGETWKLEKHLWPLLLECKTLLSKQPLFVLVNVYKTGLSPRILHNMLLQLMEGRGGNLESGEVGLAHKDNKKRILPGGIFARWSKPTSTKNPTSSPSQ